MFLHRFLLRQSLYPLLLASTLAFLFWAGRVVYSRSFNFSNLVWNLFLAWIPYLCSLAAAAVYRFSPRRRWLMLLLGMVWLAFIPNAPYIVTDFYHLGYRPPVPGWYDIMLLSTYAFTGCFLAIASLKTMHDLVRRRFGWLLGWLFAGGALALCGLGVYLGRFGRYNSWDLLVQPRAVLQDIAEQALNPLDNLQFVGFTVMFTAVLFAFYWMFVSINRLDEPARKDAA